MTSKLSRSSRSARNRPCSAICGRSSLVAATMRTSTRIGRDEPMRVTSPYSTARSSRSCAAIDSVPISSRNSVPRSASSKRPARRAGRAGERARLVAEQLGLDQRLGQRRAVHDDQRVFPAVRQAVEALGDQLLAGAALADDEHRAAHRRGAAGALDRVEEGARLADELVFPLHGPTYSEIPHMLAILTISIRTVSPEMSRNIRAISAIWHAPC